MAQETLVLCDFPAKTGVSGWESYSPFVLEVVRALQLARLRFEHRYVDMMKLRELNPLGQLPVLLIGEEKVADTTRILERIDTLSQGALTAGLRGAQLAEAWLWEEFADTALYPHVLTVRWADERGWPVPRDAFFGGLPFPLRKLIASYVRRGTLRALVGRDFTRGGLENAYRRMNAVLDHLEARSPDRGFWLSERPSVADLGLFAHLHSLRLPALPWQCEEMAKRARLCAYLDRVDAATRAQPESRPGVAASA